MLPDRISNPGPLTYKSGALPIALRGPADSTMSRTSELKYYIKQTPQKTGATRKLGLPHWSFVESYSNRCQTMRIQFHSFTPADMTFQ